MKFIALGLSMLVATSTAIKWEEEAPDSTSLFATGMDEEAFLDEEITIAGEEYRYL